MSDVHPAVRKAFWTAVWDCFWRVIWRLIFKAPAIFLMMGIYMDLASHVGVDHLESKGLLFALLLIWLVA